MMKHHRLCRKGWGRRKKNTHIYTYIFLNRFLFAFLLFCLFDVWKWWKHNRECCHFAPDSLCQWHHNVWQKWRQNVWQKCQTRQKGHPVCFPFIEWFVFVYEWGEMESYCKLEKHMHEWGEMESYCKLEKHMHEWGEMESYCKLEKHMHSIIRKVTFLFHLYVPLKRALSPRGGYNFSLNHFPPPCWHTPVIIWQVGQVTVYVNNIVC